MSDLDMTNEVGAVYPPDDIPVAAIPAILRGMRGMLSNLGAVNAQFFEDVVDGDFVYFSPLEGLWYPALGSTEVLGPVSSQRSIFDDANKPLLGVASLKHRRVFFDRLITTSKWAFTPGAVQYLSMTHAGKLTETANNSPVGIAIAPHTLFVFTFGSSIERELRILRDIVNGLQAGGGQVVLSDRIDLDSSTTAASSKAVKTLADLMASNSTTDVMYIDAFTTDGISTDYMVGDDIVLDPNAANLFLVLGGMAQEPVADYTIVGRNVIRFSEAPHANLRCWGLSSLNYANPDIRAAIDRAILKVNDEADYIINQAKAWAESSLPPDTEDPFSKSAKSWADEAARIVSDAIITVPGTNTPRSIADRFADVVNVKDFGAKGDGETDDTAAIQAALDESARLANAGKPKPVVGYGCYKISDQLLFHGGWEQEFHFGKLVVDGENWKKTAADPALMIRAQRCDIYFGLLDCGEACAGFCNATTGVTLLPGTTIQHFKTYGLTWLDNTNGVFWHPNIRQYLPEDANFAQQDAPGILVQGWDSRVIGGHIGWSKPCILFDAGSSNNIFEMVHAWCGDAKKGIPSLYEDPTLIINRSGNNNMMYNCYFDSGHIDMYDDGLHLHGGVFLENPNICNLTSGAVRYFAKGDKLFQVLIRCEDVAAATYSFESTEDTSWAGDVSKINGLVDSDTVHGYLPGYRTKVFRANNIIVPRDTNGAFEYVYKTGGVVSREYWSGSSGMSENWGPSFGMFRIHNISNAETKPAKLRLDNGGALNGMLGVEFYNGSTLCGDIYLEVNNPTASIIYRAKQIENTIGAGHGFVTTTRDGTSAFSFWIRDTHVGPASDGAISCGSAPNKWSQVYASTATINTSDAREKTTITDPDEALMRAWGKVNFKAFQFTDAVEKKGEEARIHFGVIAQQVQEAFASEGLDAHRYALFCHDKWEASEDRMTVTDKEAVLDEHGNEIEPAVTHEEVTYHPAGDRYGIRYSEALALECAYQRWRLSKLEERMASIS